MQVFYLAETQRIVIQPVAKEIPGFSVMIDYPSGALMLHKFFAQNEIHYHTGKHLATWDSVENYLVIEPANYLGNGNVL